MLYQSMSFLMYSLYDEVSGAIFDCKISSTFQSKLLLFWTLSGIVIDSIKLGSDSIILVDYRVEDTSSPFH